MNKERKKERKKGMCSKCKMKIKTSEKGLHETEISN